MENHELIGKTVQEYSDLKANSACLRKRLENIGKDLVSLGESLQGRPHMVTVSAEHIDVAPTSVAVSFGDARLPGPTRIHRGILDYSQLTALLEQYREAQKQKESLERDIRRMGLGPMLELD